MTAAPQVRLAGRRAGDALLRLLGPGSGRTRPRSLRLRLALVFWICFVLAGSGLLAVDYALVRKRLEAPGFGARVLIGGQPVERPGLQALPDGSGKFEVRIPAWLAERLPPGGEAQLEQAIRDSREAFVADALRQLVIQSGVALALLSIVVAGLAWMVAGRVLRPVVAITAAANRLSGSNLHERINLKGPGDELKELADTFDRMLGRLDAAFDGQRRFVANASHELRTPLTIMRTEIDVALADPDGSPAQLRAMAERVRGALERSEAMIASLLLLARSDRRPAATTPTDLGSAAEDALDATAAERRARRLRVETDLRPAVVAGDRALLERAVANLVENAVRHNVDGGWLRVATRVHAGRAVVSVANGGSIILPAEVGSLFEPFRRRAAGRTGSDRGAGLGLSIVRAVAEAHGGEVAARAAAAGGLEVRISLPAAPGPHGPRAAPSDPVIMRPA
jgi:signal transduction histidine kinase